MVLDLLLQVLSRRRHVFITGSVCQCRVCNDALPPDKLQTIDAVTCIITAEMICFLYVYLSEFNQHFVLVILNHLFL